jgi:protein-S-isoprenylcysteine O-methyltransferase Ste14
MRVLPGLSILIDKLPELGTPRGFGRAVLMFGGTFVVALLVLVFLDGRAPYLAVAFQLAVYVVAFFLIRDFFRPRPAFPYSEAFYNRYLPAAGLSLASLAYVVQARGVPEDGAEVYLVPPWIAYPIALYLGLSAIGLLWAALRTAGIDTLSGVYMYYPNEGRRITSSVYAVVRHPLYGGLTRAAIAFALMKGTAYALFLGTLYVWAWMPRWRELEERELHARFGDEYGAYAARVPAVFPASAEQELALLRSILRARPEAADGPPQSAPAE